MTTDKIYCVYVAENEAAVREHAAGGGFPANVISQIGQRVRIQRSSPTP